MEANSFVRYCILRVVSEQLTFKDLKIRWKEKSTHSQQDYKISTKEYLFLVGQSTA